MIAITDLCDTDAGELKAYELKRPWGNTTVWRPALPMASPFITERLRDAWEVFRGRATAVVGK